MTAGTLAAMVIIIVVLLSLIRLMLTFHGLKKNRKPEQDKPDQSRFLMVRPDQAIAVDDEGFKLPADPDSPRTVPFDQLTRLAVITTDQGPWLDDAFLALDFADGQAWLLPSEHPCYNQVYEVLSTRLPLDYEQYIAAMGSTDHAEFIIWTRPAN